MALLGGWGLLGGLAGGRDAKLSPGGVGVAPRQKAQIPDLRQLSHDTPVAALPSPGVTVAAAAEHDFALVLSDGMDEVRIRLRREATPNSAAFVDRTVVEAPVAASLEFDRAEPTFDGWGSVLLPDRSNPPPPPPPPPVPTD